FVDSEELDSTKKLYFNGNLFRRDNAAKIQAVLSSLTPDDTRRIREMETALRKAGCVSHATTTRILGVDLFKKLQSISMYDVSEVSNNTEAVLYVTRPAAFGKFGDPFVDDGLDLAKAFVSCLTYGMTRSHSSRGKITLLQRLMGQLINGDWVGP